MSSTCLRKVAGNIILFLSSTVILYCCWVANAGDPAGTTNRPGTASQKFSTRPTHEEISAPYGRVEMGFEANEGQTDHSVNFLARGAGYTLFLKPDEAVLALSGNQSNDKRSEETTKGIGPDGARFDDLVDPKTIPGRAKAPSVLRLRF